MAKILAVEDELLVRILIAETLAEAGHEVLEAADGESALAIASCTPDIDLIISDVRLPKMDGFQLVIAASELKPNLPALFMTGYMGMDVPANLSAAKIMQKPFDPDELVVAVDSLLASRN